MCTIIIAGLIFIILIACAPENSSRQVENPLSIFAAASLTSVMPQLREAFQNKHRKVKIEFNFAASSILAKQIEHGAEADIFISANPQWTNFLVKKNQLQKNIRSEFLSNKLVLIIPQNTQIKITSLLNLTQPNIRRIALADWAHVPAGIYAKRALEKFGIWEKIKSRCLPALDVRAALTYVEHGDADCGIVYRTDAAISNNVKVVSELPMNIQPKIRYVIALTRHSMHPLAPSFLAFVQSPEAQKIFKKNGFDILNDE
ncbi:MAG: molybdate ABC transporter substrate-binding protein [bacterium]